MYSDCLSPIHSKSICYRADAIMANDRLPGITPEAARLGREPVYVRNALIPSVVARPLRGEVPTIGLMMGYSKSNTSPLLKRFLLRADELVNRVFQGEA